jgi:hypothetical protein
MTKVLSFIVGTALLVAGIIAIAPSGASAQTLPAGCTSSFGYSSSTGASCNGAATYPTGCTSTTGYNTLTGQPCNGAALTINGGAAYPAGCSSNSGYSVTTGQPCNYTTGVAPIGTTFYIPGCTSSSGFSTVSGQSCSTTVSSAGMVNGYSLVPGCTTAMTGYSPLTGQSCYIAGAVVTTPGVPNTGANNPVNLAVFAASLALIAFGIAYGAKRMNA